LLSQAKGVWVEVTVLVGYMDDGFLDVSITRLDNNTQILSVTDDSIDMWRGPEEGETPFVRSKWGIYSSTVETGNL